MPIDLISAAFELIAGQGFELAKDKAKRSERILEILNAIGLKQDAPPANEFDGVYAYTLVVYGIDKPKPILEFFRHQFIKDAFRKSFEQRDTSILEKETEQFLDWNEVGKELIKLDCDPRREFAEFREQFITATNLTRTIHEVLIDKAFEDNLNKIQELPTKEDLEIELAPLNEKLNNILEAIQGQSKRQEIIPFVLPQPDVSDFVGRKFEIEQLEKLIIAKADNSTTKIAGITGMGGIGKTTLAIHFANKYRDQFPDGVIGLNVSGNSMYAIALSFASLVGVQANSIRDLSAAQIMQLVFRHRKTLLIFDDAEDNTVRTLYPGGNLCSVIVTTRNTGLLDSLFIPESTHIKLGTLSMSESTNLLLSMVRSKTLESNPAIIQEIYELVAGLPLALRMVSGYLNTHPTISLDKYISKLRNENYRQTVFDEPSKVNNLRSSFEHTLAYLTTSQQTLLANLGSLGTERLSILTAYKVSNQSEEEFVYNLDRLKKLSLVNTNENNPLDITMHPLMLDFAKSLAIHRKDAVYYKKEKQIPQAVAKKSDLKVFLCHSSYDKPAVRSIYQKLNSVCEPWLDEEKIMPGEDWDAAIRKAVKESHIILVCLSKSSLTKEGYVQKEIRMALDLALEKLDNTIFIIPIRLEACEVPEKLLKWQYLDYFNNPNWFEKLRLVLTRRVEEFEKL